MYFIDEKNGGEKVNKCPDCGKGEVLPWIDCPPSCPGKKLEEKHIKIVLQMLSHGSFDPKIKPVFIENFEQLSKYEYYKKNMLAWTNHALKEVYLPWYILRSKCQFFNVMMHELAHFIAYDKKFSSKEREVIERFQLLEHSPCVSDSKRWNYYEKNKVIIDKCWQEHENGKGGHWHDQWYLSYKELFGNFYDSEFKKYTYGKISKPLKYGFSEDGKGEYEVEIVEYK